MSEVQPPDPNSEESTPEAMPEPMVEPTPKAAPVAIDSPWDRVKVAWRSLRIQTLRTTIRSLQGWLEQLEATAASVPASTSSPSGSWFGTLLALLVNLWLSLLAGLRNLLPQGWRRSFSDPVLSGVVVGTIVLVFWITSSLFGGQPTQVAQAPTPPAPNQLPSSEVTTPESPAPLPSPVAPAPALSPPEPVADTPAPTPEPIVELPTSTPEPEVSPEPEATIVEPSPSEMQPLLEAGEPGQPPDVVFTPVLTPEESLIASIQSQVAEVTSRYADGLIQSIQANFPGSRLTVRIQNRWYNLTPGQQDKIVQEIFQRAKDLDFTKLDILDEQGSLLARNPLIGENVVILKRSLS